VFAFQLLHYMDDAINLKQNFPDATETMGFNSVGNGGTSNRPWETIPDFQEPLPPLRSLGTDIGSERKTGSRVVQDNGSVL
jgi:hypothetical protein